MSRPSRPPFARSRFRPILEPLERRELLAAGLGVDPALSLASASPTIDVLLVNDAIPGAAALAASAAPGVVAVVYPNATTDTAGLVDLLQGVAARHGGAAVARLGLVAHGTTGSQVVGAGAVWSAQTLPDLAVEFSRLDALLCDGARIDLFGCGLAADGPARDTLARLAGLTGAVVRASTDDVGTAAGADLEWEFATGHVADGGELLDAAKVAALPAFSLLGDWAEENNSPATAFRLGRAGISSWNGLSIHNAADADYFRIRLDQFGLSIDYVRITFDPAGGELDLKLFRDDGREVGFSTGTGGTRQVDLAGLSAGYYRVKVFGVAGAANDYDLRLAGPPLTYPDIAESNDYASEAFVMPDIDTGFTLDGLSINTNGDRDYFRLRLRDTGDAASNVRIEFDHRNGAGDLNLEVYRAVPDAWSGFTLGERVGQSATTADFEAISLEGFAAGHYFVRVYGQNGATSGYSLSAEGPPRPAVDRFEPNETRGAAADLGSLMGQSIRSDLTLNGDGDADWFTFRTGRTGSVGHYVRAEFAPGQAGIDLELYDAQGNLLRTSSTLADAEEVSLAGLPEGTYFARVVGHDPEAATDYDLRIHTFEGWSPDASEPNDSRAAAFNLGTVALPRTLSGMTIHAPTESDWFKLTTARIGGPAHVISVDHSRSSGDLDAALYDDAGNLLAVAHAATNSELLSLAGRPAGTYYVRVFAYAGDPNSYSLRINPPGAPVPDAMEPNQTVATARDLGLIRGSRTWTGLTLNSAADADCYRFTTSAVGAAGHALTVAFRHDQGDVEVRLFNAAGVEVGRSNGSGDGETVSLAGLPAGRYTARVSGVSGAVNPSYSLTVSAPAGPAYAPDRFEANNSLASATLVRTNTSAATLTGMQYLADLNLHAAGDRDFYRFTTTGPGRSTHSVRLTYGHAGGDVDVQLLDSAGRVVRTSAGSTGTETIPLDGLAAGSYALRVYSPTGAANGYSLVFDTPLRTAGRDPWTVLVYIAASNLEEFAFADVNELEVAAATMPDVNFVVYWDQSSRHTTYPTGNGSQPAWGTAGRAVIRPDLDMARVATTFDILPEKNSGAAETLGEFVAWATAFAPASRYALTLWGHGGGLAGSNYDDGDPGASDVLTVAEVVSALSGRERMNLVAFDACHMATVEYVAALRPLTDVVVASQDAVEGHGFDYTTAFDALLGDPRSASAEAVAVSLVRSFAAQYGSSGDDDTLAAFRTSGIGALLNAFGAFAAAVQSATASQLDAVDFAARRAVHFQYGWDYQRDVGAFARLIAGNVSLPATLRNAANGINAALAAALIANTRDSRSSSGLSVYLPVNATGLDVNRVPGYAGDFNAFAAKTGWMGVLSRLARPGTGPGLSPDWTEAVSPQGQPVPLNQLQGPGNAFTALSLHNAADEDWFRFGVATGPALSVALSTAKVGDALLARLYNAAGILILSRTITTGGVLSLAGLPGGPREYRLRVSSVGGRTVGKYSFSINAPMVAPGDWVGDNGVSERPYDLGPVTAGRVFPGLSAVPSGADFYTLRMPTLAAAQWATVNVRVVGKLPLNAQIRDAAGFVVASAAGVGVLSLPYTRYGAGESYTLVVNNPNGARVSYSLVPGGTDGAGAYVRDAFARADGALGASWKTSGSVVLRGQRAVSSGNVTATRVGFTGRDVGVQARFFLPAVGDASFALRARTHVVGSGVYGYTAQVSRLGTFLVARIYRYATGVATLLSAAPVSSAAGLLRLEAQSRNVRLLLDGVERLRATDSVLIGPGSAGIIGGGGVAFDDFQAGAIAPALSFATRFDTGVDSSLAAGWVRRDGDFSVHSGVNNLLLTSVSPGGSLWLYHPASVADSTARARFKLELGQTVGLVGRYSVVGGVATYYLASVSRSASGTSVALTKVVGNARFLLGRVPLAVPFGELAFSLRGDALHVWVDGLTRVAVTDSSLRAAGLNGISATFRATLDDLILSP